eukprot:m.6837 g.6837  ORF g.6837 m.6837 type:complete len:241 (-) comp5196_c0_seq1:399-1121(-)
MDATTQQWLQQQLSASGVDDESYVEYIWSMVEDSDEGAGSPEAVESVAEFLTDLLEDEGAATALATKIVERLSQVSGATSVPEVAEPSRLLEDFAQQLQVKLDDKAKQVEEERKAASTLTAEEKQRQMTLMREVEAESDEDDGEDGEDGEGEGAEYHPKRVSAKKMRRQRKEATAADLAMEANTNRLAVANAHQQKHQAARDAAKSKAARDKTDLQADKARKDKAKEERKKKAQKQERRR